MPTATGSITITFLFAHTHIQTYNYGLFQIKKAGHLIIIANISHESFNATNSHYFGNAKC
jgi:bacteriorhodopsin